MPYQTEMLSTAAGRECWAQETDMEGKGPIFALPRNPRS
jgi:hypothetical protein